MWQPLELLNNFDTLSLKQIFWKIKAFFKKLDYRYLVESTEFENEIFLDKTVFSEANVKKNRMGSAKGIITKNSVLGVTTTAQKMKFSIKDFFSNFKFHFLRSALYFFWNFVPVQKLLIKSWFVQNPKCTYAYFSKALELYLRVRFPCKYP